MEGATYGPKGHLIVEFFIDFIVDLVIFPCDVV